MEAMTIWTKGVVFYIVDPTMEAMTIWTKGVIFYPL